MSGGNYFGYRWVLEKPGPQVPCTYNIARPFFGMADYRPVEGNPWFQDTPLMLQCPVVRAVTGVLR